MVRKQQSADRIHRYFKVLELIAVILLKSTKLSLAKL
jgi:hypothetical protein